MQSVQSVHTVSVDPAGKLRPLLYQLASDRTFYMTTQLICTATGSPREVGAPA